MTDPLSPTGSLQGNEFRTRSIDELIAPPESRSGQTESTQTFGGILVPEDRLILSQAARELSDGVARGDANDLVGERAEAYDVTANPAAVSGDPIEQQLGLPGGPAGNGQDRRPSTADRQATGQQSDSSGLNDQELTEDEQRQVDELKARDREVRAHENAHKAAAGSLAQGGPHYEYETGPDGRRYAVGGHVNISVGEGRTPEETLANATKAREAALAPAEPSSQDRAVAAKAAGLAQEARAEIAEERREEAAGADGASPEAAVAAGGNQPVNSSDFARAVEAYGAFASQQDTQQSQAAQLRGLIV